MHNSDYEANLRRYREMESELLTCHWRANPVRATLSGVHEFDRTLGDVSADFYTSMAGDMRRCARRLQSEINPLLLSDGDLMDYRLALSLAATNEIVYGHERPWEVNPAMYTSLGLWGCYSLLVHESIPLEERVSAMVSRMHEIPEMLRVSKGNIENPAPIYVQIAVEIAKSGLSFFRNVIPILASDLPEMADELVFAGDSAIRAYEEYEEWLWNKAMPHADGDFAIGVRNYEQRLFIQHYLTYGPHDLVVIAERALDEFRAELIETAREIDPQAEWHDLVSRLKDGHPSADGLLSAYQGAIRAARQFIIEHGLASIPEGDSIEVVYTPEFERNTVPYAAYLPPPLFDKLRHGRFWVTPVDSRLSPDQQDDLLRSHCRYTIPVTAVHEGYPGHHLQTMWAGSRESSMAKATESSLLAEGWAMYCEELMHEEGFYSDPRIRLFQLRNSVWRACRVIIDVGLHTRGMSLEEATRILIDTAGLEPVNAVAEVKRYTVTPTQPMTYMIGQMLISDARERMHRKQRSRFDLRAFHDEFLSYGTIPVALITQSMMRKPRLLNGNEELLGAA